jgi:hypothetical protein
MDANLKREHAGDLDDEPQAKRRKLNENKDEILKSLEADFKMNSILAANGDNERIVLAQECKNKICDIAHNGNLQASFLLTRLYEEGWGLGHYHVKALEYFKKAAFLGDIEALDLLREHNILDKTDYFSRLPSDIIFVIMGILDEEDEQTWYIRRVSKICCLIFDRSLQMVSTNMLMFEDRKLNEITAFLSRLHSLNTLNLEESNWSNFTYPFIEMEEFFKNCVSLTSVNLCRINFGDNNCEHEDHMISVVVQYLSVSKNLMSLSLWDNKICYMTDFITTCLESNSNLTKLDLTGNLIGNDQLEYIIRLLRKNSSIKILSLSANEIGEHPKELEFNLLRSLVSSTNLQELDLSCNYIEVERFIRLFLSNTTLINLNILDCFFKGFEKRTIDAVAELWEKNKTLEELQITCLSETAYMHEVMKGLACIESIDSWETEFVLTRNESDS